MTPDPGTEVDLPREQVGAQPQHLLLTILADYSRDAEEYLPSGALVAVMGEFAISDAGARTALSRLSRRGLLLAHKVGRKTFYRLTDQARITLARNRDRAHRVSVVEPEWNGKWTLVAFSILEDTGQLRAVLRSVLRSLGFARLYSGLWISPYAPPPDFDQILKDLQVKTSTIFVSRAIGGTANPLSAWDLDSLRARYKDFLSEFSSLRRDVVNGAVPPSAALQSRATISDRWRDLCELEPGLPSALLPVDWPGQPAAEMFAEVHEGLAPLAETRFRQIVTLYENRR